VASPAIYRLAFENVTFRSADGTRLAGWLVPATPKHPRGVIVLCHGVDSTREAMLTAAVNLHADGFATFLFDFRARGESGGNRCTLGYREVDDLLAAIRYLQTRPDTRALPLGVLGESMGGAVALMGTARCPAVRGVVAESPFARLDDAVNNHLHTAFGFAGPIMAIPTRWWGEQFIGRRCAEIAPVAEIGRIAPRPLLLIQDGADRLCPPEETRQLMAAAGAPKTLWTVPGAVHIAALSVAPGEYVRRVNAFFEAACK
jgi:alpha-beta hydrolase superfamily lysophospholipase